MYDNYLFRAAQVVSFIPGLIGINLLTRLEATLQNLQFTIPSDPQARKLIRGVTRIYGSRNIIISFLFFNLGLTRDKKLISLAYFSALAMSLFDGFVAKAVIGHGEWQHWGFVPICVAFLMGLHYSP